MPTAHATSRLCFRVLILALVTAPQQGPGRLSAQQRVRPPANGGITSSLGQPNRWRWSGGLGAGGWFENRPFEGDSNNTFMARVELGVTRDLYGASIGLLSMHLEGLAGYRGNDPEFGLRALLQTGYLGGGVGVEYNSLDDHALFLLRLETPLQRGGLFGSGGMIRLNWYPTETSSFTLGLSHPLGQPHAGKTRPQQEKTIVAAEFPDPVPYQVDNPELEAALDTIRTSAEWIRRSVTPFLDQDGRNIRTAEARMASYIDELATQLERRPSIDEVRWFHAWVERAYTLAAGDAGAGKLTAAKARELLLEEVLLPYNSLLGRKKRHDQLVELGIAARGRFGNWAASSGVVAVPRVEQVQYVFQELLEEMESLRERSSKEWDDPRLTWLPLQYGLLPEDHDTQAEIDALTERAVSHTFEPGNRILYLVNLQFHWELLRMIHEARQYHVLWIHDFPAVTEEDRLDGAAFTQVVDGYLAALAERVEKYDREGVLPQFFIFLDQHYYEARKSRIWMSMLEDPLAASGDLSGASEEQRRRLQAALDRLRRAVGSSIVLQNEARQYGGAWLRNRVKVQVNITYKADPSFFGGGLVSSVFGYSDNVMRDHRKLSFYDVGEDNPQRGMAIYTGMGVGEQYLGPSWEDRSLLVRGPLLLDLKREVRDLLLSQGLKPEEIPLVFREVSTAGAAAGNGTDSTTGSRAMQLHNRTGYEAKPLNVAKAVLYSLMPPGSVIKIPDSLWNSMFFAGLLTGASCRGVRVMIVSPARTNAPSAGFPQMTRAWELATRLLDARTRLARVMGAAGGALHVGLYALQVEGDAFVARVNAWNETVAATPFLRELMPFTAELGPVTRWAAASAPDSSATGPTSPKLHHKVQFFASRDAWDALSRSRLWPEFMRTYLSYRQATMYVRGEFRESRNGPTQLAELARRMFAEVEAAAGERAVLYAIVGSQNQDYRGMFMDGEVGVLIAGHEALAVLVDLVFLEGTVTWLEDRATVDRLLGRPGEMERRLTRIIKDAL